LGLAALRTGRYVLQWPTRELVALAAHHSIPTVYAFRDYAAAASYELRNQFVDAYREVGVYAGGFSKAKSRPISQSSSRVKVELVVNLKTAKALGLTFPLSLLGRADEVIE